MALFSNPVKSSHLTTNYFYFLYYIGDEINENKQPGL